MDKLPYEHLNSLENRAFYAPQERWEKVGREEVAALIKEVRQSRERIRQLDLVRDAARKVDAMYDSLDEHGSQHQRLGPWKELHEALKACDAGDSGGEDS